MNFSKFFHHASGYSPHSQKKEDIAKIDPLFHYFYFITAFYIAKQILIYFITDGYEDKLWLITTPIAIIGAMFFLMVFGSCRIRRIEFQKHKIVRYQYWFDLLKTLIYMIFMITATEFKLLENNQVIKSTPAEMFWFSLELALLASPTILSLRGKAANFVVLFFHFVYLYVRMEGFSDSNVEASFCLVHIIPLTIFIYRNKIQEENSHKGKVKQEEDGKFASTVLNLLPEGVAIVDEDGLQYMNNSLRTIMKVKDEECLEALFALENRQFADESAVSSAFVKKSLSLNKDNPEQQQKTLYNFKPEQNKSPYAKASEHEAHSKSPKLKEHRERKRAYSSSIESSKLTKRPTKTHTPGGKKYSAFYKNVLEFGTDEAINSSGISSTKLLQNKDGLDESQKRVKESEECFSPIYSDGGLSSSFREDRSPDSPLSSPGVSSLRKKIKKILHKIEEPYKKSHHKTVKEAIADILTKMKEEFAPDTMSGVIMSLFAKIDPIMQRKMSLGQGPLGQEKKPIRIKPQSLGPNRWAIVMQSIREVAPGCLQYLEVKFTPILTNGKSALILLVRDVTEKEIIKKMEEKEKSQSLALASVSHEFRTPLNGIMGMLENLKDHISSEVTQNFVVPAYNSAKLLLTLVNDILDFHQLKEQKLVLVPVRFNLKAKLEESLSLIAIQAKARGLQLKAELDNKVPRFICNDPNRVQQVVNNLVGNAIKFTVEGSITVRAEYYSERKVLIKVIDTGIGIEQSNIEKLFKAFGKIDSKQNRELNPQGVGLGLTISNSLAKVLCSTERVSGLNVASEPNKGSTFSFVLDNVYSPEEEYVVDDDDETKNLSENIESLYRKYYKGENLVSTSVVHFPNSVTTLKELHSPNNIHRNAFTTSLAGISMSESPTKLEIPSEVDRADRVERIVRERANRANTGNGGVRKKVLRRTFVMNDNLGRIVEKLKESRGKPPLVLVIDDNEYNHLILKNFLELFEIEVHSAYNGKQGLDKIKQRTSEGANGQYMMVFIDIEMPIMDGLECTKEIKALVKSGDLTEIPLIAQSAHSEAEGAPKCLEAGMMDYIQKPIAKAKLIEMLVKWLPKEE